MLKKKHVESRVVATPECYIYRPQMNKQQSKEWGVTYASPLARKARKVRNLARRQVNRIK